MMDTTPEIEAKVGVVFNAVVERMKPCLDFINEDVNNFILFQRMEHKEQSGNVYDAMCELDVHTANGSKFTCLHYINLNEEELKNLPENDNHSALDKAKTVDCDCIRSVVNGVELIELSEFNRDKRLMIFDMSNLMGDFLGMMH